MHGNVCRQLNDDGDENYFQAKFQLFIFLY